MPERRRITKKDWNNIEQFITDELDTRKGSKARKRHTKIWKEVDRQVAMEGMSRVARDRDAQTDWRNALELGELSRASEIITADIRRLTFPQNRDWFDVHSNIPLRDQQVAQESGFNLQRATDGRTRAFMTQQQLDFGFKARVDLSVKEALHHGSYVATVEWENAVNITAGTGVSVLSSPVWVPHSMWNCFPDMAGGGHNTFYQGSMIIVRYKAAHEVKKMRSPNKDYPFFNLSKIKKTTNHRENADDTDDVELIYYYGDLVMPRQSGNDLLLLNSRAILANGLIIHYMPNPSQYQPIIYNGWERLDVRDPYYVSPIVKFSVDQKIGSQLANRFLDAVDLKTEPPVTYDSNDPDYALNGGPDISPGAKTGTKGSANFDVMDVGDPGSALTALQWIVGQIEAGTKVDRVRSGVSAGTEQTATEVIKQSQSAELSTTDFVDKHELHGIRPYLYMAHDLNRDNLKSYQFFNKELDSPDFEIMKKSELPKEVQFDIVGSKGILGEERRQAQTSQVTAFWMGSNPQMLNQVELAKEMYRDAGNKNPEKFLNIGEQAEIIQQQVEAIIQQAQQQIQILQQQIAEFTFQDEEHSLEIQQKELEKEQLQTSISALRDIIRLQGVERNTEKRLESDRQLS